MPGDLSRVWGIQPRLVHERDELMPERVSVTLYPGSLDVSVPCFPEGRASHWLFPAEQITLPLREGFFQRVEDRDTPNAAVRFGELIHDRVVLVEGDLFRDADLIGEVLPSEGQSLAKTEPGGLERRFLIIPTKNSINIYLLSTNYLLTKLIRITKI